MKNFKGMLISSLAITTFAGVGTTFVTNTVHAANNDSSKIQVRSNKSINTTPSSRLPVLSVNPYDDRRFSRQGYLEEAPLGINAPYAWGIKGGDGQGATFVDLEEGWLLNHEDLVGQNIEFMSGKMSNDLSHGTSVLGVVSAADNGIGNIGIAPKAKAKVISVIRDNGRIDVRDAILSAVDSLQAGDVLLIEESFKYDGYGDDPLPVEVYPSIFNAIRKGTDKGIIIVEAAGNGGIDLDEFKDRNGKQILNRNSPDFKDSGAIIVGASTARVPHKRLGFSNYGSRIDVYGWGEYVDTLDTYQNQNSKGQKVTDQNIMNRYTSNFRGTSSASPIIAGAAVSIQGIAKEHLGKAYTPKELRAILSNPNTGTKSNNPSSDKIGVLPDLKAILSNLGFHSDLTTNDPMVFPDNVEKNEGKENSTFVFPGEETKRTGDKNSTVNFPEEDLKQEEKEEGLIIFPD
ncbi:TPA: S8 family peptidase [Bacillus thuringiensis]|nr:S8 family serine peptidase [Bacillus cereus]HDR4798665.1 S8 family serine peptidase [Bacillus cereus]HDR4804746.1 S8 family serine peptidase [Bacillus cereus]HDR4810620.1 S8 family serine peptidase [Bacillus cereus]HDR4833084.1 S8 family serine peptidase [Bacillus cereus]